MGHFLHQKGTYENRKWAFVDGKGAPSDFERGISKRLKMAFMIRVDRFLISERKMDTYH